MHGPCVCMLDVDARGSGTAVYSYVACMVDLHACFVHFGKTKLKGWDMRSAPSNDTPCLDTPKNLKLYKILHHIESCGTYMEH